MNIYHATEIACDRNYDIPGCWDQHPPTYVPAVSHADKKLKSD